jgi:hypothetical protein
MCEPVSIAAAAVAVGSTVASMYGQKEATEFQAEQGAKSQRRANQAAYDSYILNTKELGLGIAQEDEILAEERLAIDLETQKRVATAKAASAESGLAGYSIDSQLDDIFSQGSRNQTVLDANADYAEASRSLQRKSLYEGAKNQQAGFKPYQPSSGLFYTGSALQIAGAGAQGYSLGKSMSSPKQPNTSVSNTSTPKSPSKSSTRSNRTPSTTFTKWLNGNNTSK